MQPTYPQPNEDEEKEEDYNRLGYIPRPMQPITDSILSKHLNTQEILNTLKKMLMGYEWNDETDEWKKSEIEFVDANGITVTMNEPPLMNPKEIRITIGYLQMFLNSNTYLSRIKEERVNDIMWDINCKLAALFYRLRHRLSPETRDLIWGMIEYPILLGLERAGDKITLDAMSKMQHTIENINPRQEMEEKKNLKLFGF